MRSRISMWVTVATIFAALALPISLVAQEQQKAEHRRYKVIDLGTLGGTFSLANSINNRGEVGGFSRLPGDLDEHAFLWSEGVMTDLGTLGGPNSGFGFWGEKPNERGQIVGAAQTSTPDPLGEDFCSVFNNFFDEAMLPPAHLICLPFVWQNGVMTPLPTLGGNNGVATEINNRGQVAGGAENATPPDPTCVGLPLPKPVLWEKGVIQELPTFPGDVSGVVGAINDKGQATGVSVNSCIPSVSHALLWQNGRLTDLGNLGGNFFDEGVDINSQGQVVGFSSLPGDATFHAFLWTEDNGIQDLGTLPGDVFSFAPGINDKGRVVGQSCNSDFSVCRAFLWQKGVMTDLNTLLPAGSPLFLLAAFKINSRGEIVGLTLQTSTGQFHAFLAAPCDEEHADNEGCENAADGTTAVRGATSQRPKVAVPENVRKLLRQRLGRWSGIPGPGTGPTN